MKRVTTVLFVGALALTAACSKKKDSAEPAATPPPAGSVNPAGTVAAGGGNGVNGINDGLSATAYRPTGAPPKVAPAIPGTLTIEAAGLRIDAEGEDASNQADATKAEGYVRLHDKMLELSPVLTDLTVRLYMFDSVMGNLKAACAGLPCTIESAEATLTAEMAESVFTVVGGKTAIDADKAKEVESRIGVPEDLGKLVISAPAEGSGFDQCVTIVESETNSSVYCYSPTNISVDYRYREFVVGDNPNQKIELSASYSLTYDLAKDALVLIDESLEGTTRSRDSFKLQSNPKSTKKNAIIATLDLSSVEPSYGSWSATMSVIADDEGGIVDTDYAWDEQTVTDFVVSATTGDGTEYYLMPPTATAAAQPFDSLGYVEGKETDGPTNYVYYYGPTAIPAAMKLFTISYDEEGSISLVDSTLTADLTLQISKQHFYYLEEFGATGAVSYTCSKTVRNLTACDYEDGTAGAYAAEFNGTDFGFGDAFLQIKLAGAGANAAAFGAETWYVMPGGIDLTNELPAVIGYVPADLLAWGVFNGDPASPSSTSMEGYKTEVFASSAAQFNGAKIWKIAYQASGEAYFALVTDVTVTATE